MTPYIYNGNHPLGYVCEDKFNDMNDFYGYPYDYSDVTDMSFYSDKDSLSEITISTSDSIEGAVR